ncbi:helix-turn-helix transcriptional regulator [Sinorhizobium meliloti]|uniref:Helix-turn-helix transcriptional regulator n=1 Tax=Rhizobium meliloti TaxID=382 RepID=A0AAW9TJZ6_RHIML|nr:helix-turn-helix transcriptional regulator [Sinorhizobium meliloti]MQW32148.1 helix-turn-helix transcriptional regulator [Sinorhizobium meliloti]
MPMDANFDLEAIERAFVEAAVDPTKWKEAMTVAARATGSTGALLFDAQSHLPGIPQSENMEAATEAYIQGGWSERDVRYGILSRLLQKGVATDLDLFTADQIERHPYYQEFLAPHKLRWFAGVKVASGDSLWCLSIQRSIEQGPFSPDQLETLADLSRRLASASAVSNMLGFSRVDAALDAYERSNTPAFVFDVSGNVLRLNASAEMLLGDTLKITGRRLTSSDRNATQALETLLHEVIVRESPRSPGPILLPRPGRRPMLAYVQKLPSVSYSPLAPGQAVAVVTDPEAARTPTLSALQACFEPTVAEAKLAQNIALGKSLERIGHECGIAYDTARNQLKAVFAKTDTHSQCQLASLLSRL